MPRRQDTCKKKEEEVSARAHVQARTHATKRLWVAFFLEERPFTHSRIRDKTPNLNSILQAHTRTHTTTTTTTANTQAVLALRRSNGASIRQVTRSLHR